MTKALIYPSKLVPAVGRASAGRGWIPMGTLAGVLAAVLGVVSLYAGVRAYVHTEALPLAYAHVAPAAGPEAASRLKSIEEIHRLAAQR